MNRSAETGVAETFDATGSIDPDGDMLTFTWDFGDGNKDVGPSVTHTYDNEANYTVTLTADDGNGGVDIDTIRVNVVYVFHGTGVYGQVYDNVTSNPIEDVRVGISGYDYVKDEYFFDDTYTDVNGYYEFHTPDGDFWIYCSEDGYYDYDNDIMITKDQGIEHNIFLNKIPPETARIFGYIYDNYSMEPLESADISIDNYEGHYNWSYSNMDGYYEMNAPPGDYTLECYAWDWEEEIEYEAFYTDISLSAHQQLRLDIYLKREVPDDYNVTLEFSTWDMLTLTQKITEYSNTYWTRSSMDSNDDGTISEAEVTAYEAGMESMYEYYVQDFNTQHMLLVDDIDYLYIENTVDVQVEGATGPTSSTTPIITTVSLDLKSNHTIPIADTHVIELNATYDSYWGNYTFHIRLPSLFEMTNYTATENVNVTGKTDIRIEPYEDPDPEDDFGSEWILLDIARTV
jgi:hypothetical protein